MQSGGCVKLVLVGEEGKEQQGPIRCKKAAAMSKYIQVTGKETYQLKKIKKIKLDHTAY